MTRFASSSTASVETQINLRASSAVWPWLLTAALLAAYATPWLVTHVAALSFGAYDLAEWASLPPAARSTEPALLTALLLRLGLTAITLLFALWTGYRRGTGGWWAGVAVVVLLAVAQLPPLEFFTVDGNDINYRQQFTLAIISLIAGVGLLLARPGVWRWWAAAAIAALAAATSYVGTAEALALARGYGLDARPGGGLWLAIMLFAVALLFSVRSARRR